MSGNLKNLKALVAENHDLRVRLEKAEATLREIRSRDADAKFVKGEGGRQPFAPTGADQSSRILSETVSEGALTLTTDGVVLRANQHFAAILGIPVQKLIGCEIHSWFAAASRAELRTLLHTKAAGTHFAMLTMAAADGTHVPVHLSVSQIDHDGIPNCLYMRVTDLSERKGHDPTLAAEKLAHAILEQAADAIVICDAGGRIIRASKRAQLLHGKNLIGQLFEHAFPLFQLNGAPFLPVGAVDPNYMQALEATLTQNGREYHVLVSVGHLHSTNKELLGSVVTLTDITERELAAATLRASEAEFHTLAESMPQIVWVLQADRRNIYFNQQWMDYTGLTFEESNSHGWGKVIHPDDQQRAWEVWQQAVKGGGVYSVESRLRRTDGTYRWWLVRGVPRIDAHGNVLKWFGTCTDIHEIRTAELELSRANSMLRESERRFSDLLNNVELVSMMLDREGTITYCNDYLLRLSGWQYEELVGKSWLELFVPPEVQNTRGSAFAAIFTTQSPVRHHENEILTRAGERRLIRWNNSVLLSADGEAIGTAHIGEDITAKKQAERDIQFKNTILQTQQDTSPDAILVVDDNLQIISYNQQFIDLWQLPVETVSLGLDGPVLDMVVSQIAEPEAFVARVQYLYVHRELKDQTELLLNDGRILHRYSAPLAGSDGTYYGRMWYFRDITTRKTSEVALQKSQRQLSQALKIARIGYWEYESSTDEFIFNDQYYSLHGVTADEAGGYRMSSGRFASRYVHPDDASLVFQQIQRALEGTRSGYSATLEMRMLAGDGETVWMEVRFNAVREAEGRSFRVTGVAQDINERKRGEQELIESRRRFSDVLENVELVSMMLDRDGRITYCNDYLLRLTGWQYEEIIGKSWFELFVPFESQSLRESKFVALLANQTEARHHENDILTRSGERRLIRWSNSILLSADGEAIGTAHIGEDITETKRAEREIQLKNTILQTQQDTSPDAILVVDEQRKMLSRNQQFNVMWGISADMILEEMGTAMARNVAKMVVNPDAFLAGVLDIYERRNEESHDEILLKDGRVLDRYTAPAVTAEGQYYGRIWYFRDITERKRAEELLSESEQKQRAIFESANDGMLVAEVDTGRVVSANPAICRMLGYTLEEFLSLYISDIHPQADLPYVLNELHKLAQGYTQVSTDICVRRKNGSTFYVDISAGRLRVDNKDCIIAIFRDITERKQSQDAIYHLNEELERKVLTRTAELELARLEADQANRAKSEFLAAMSHEIRTPMNGVIGMIDVLQQSKLNDVQVDMANVIRDSAFALLNLINDILDFSKIEAGKIRLDSAPMSLSGVIESVGDMFMHSAFKNNVSLRIFVDPALPGQVVGDAGRLRQILVNLVGNAVKFSGGQSRSGKVSLRVGLLLDNHQSISVEFCVRDNGIGMDAATQATLFTPFAQANSSTATKFGGTGLGLIITQQLVHLMDGEIIVSSELHKGTEMRVRLPFNLLPQSTEARDLAPALVGLVCLLVGFEDSLEGDLANYLAHAGAQPRPVDADKARRVLLNYPAGQYVVLFDHTVTESERISLREIVRSRFDLKVGWVVIGRGERRRSRVVDDALVVLNGDSLHCSELVRAVGIAAGRVNAEIETQSTPSASASAVGPPTREMAIQQGSLVLVAEDNEINQKVIQHQLHLLRRAADFADDGREALEKWQSGEYSLVLTDLNMPVMNGWDLSVAIRRAETGGSHIPIVALTANALKAEADRCREMGMDDYVSKPVLLAELKAALDKWLPAASEAFPLASTPPQADTSAPVDLSVLKELTHDDAEIIREFLVDFQISAARIGRELHLACDAGQAVVVGELMHKLKSSARSMGALALGTVCAEMEAAATAGCSEALTLLLPRFDQELSAVILFIESMQEK